MSFAKVSPTLSPVKSCGIFTTNSCMPMVDINTFTGEVETSVEF